MKRMSWASRSQSPARDATHADAPSASLRFLSALARDWRANFSAFVEPLLDPFRRAVLVAILPPPVYETPTQTVEGHTRLSGHGRQSRPHVRADVNELPLLQLKLLQLQPRQLRPDVPPIARLQVDPDLEPQVHDPLDLHLLGALGRE